MMCVEKTGLAVRTALAVSGFWLCVVALGSVISTSPLRAQTASSGGAEVTESAVLRPGDSIRLRIWREPDLSGEFTIDEHGVVILPRLGPITVTDEPAEALKARLTQAYAEHLSHPSITIVLLRRVQVLGAVRNPGLYQVEPTMSISDVLALAGGATSQGKTGQVELIRNGTKMPGRLSLLTPIGASPVRSGDQLIVPYRNWIARNPGTSLAIVSTAISLIFTLTR